MGLGGTARKLQSLAERAEQLYEQLVALRERTIKLEESVDESTARVRQLEVESEKQRVLLRALAEEQGIDVDEILAEAAIEEAEPPGVDDAGGPTADAGTDTDGAADASGGTGATGAAESNDDADDGASDESASDDEPTVIDSGGNRVE